jgi:formylglycine-generating enzyme required for sulfatase activity
MRGASPEDPGVVELQTMIGHLEELGNTALPRARADLERVTHLRARSIDRRREAWDRAIEDIAARPTYRGLGRIRPQLGLVPLRRDPNSGLWEFWHVASGACPRIDPESNKLILTPEDGIVLVLLPGGSFMMGSPPEAERRDPNERWHKVTLSPFFVGKFEVTQAQWKRAMGTNPSYYLPGLEKGDQVVTWLNPVEEVNWYECRDFLNRLCLTFPTEAQWEYACRAGTDTVYVWGDSWKDFEGKENLKDQSWPPLRSAMVTVSWNDGHQIHAPVGSFAANPFGLYDIQGNVSEWTADVFADEYPEDSNVPGDGLSTVGTGPIRSLRGASWHEHPFEFRTALRNKDQGKGCDMARGLRAARPLED